QVKGLAYAVTPLDEARVPAGAAEGGAGDGPRARPLPSDTVDVGLALHVLLDADRHGDAGLRRLRDVLARYPGDRTVLLSVRAGGREVTMQAGELRVAASPRVVQEVEELLGPHSAAWIAHRHG
ncbi:MAG: hypothetical protein K6W08_15340, partial [Firmicutes bacterium]|nr:hypothetical protein [Bacillota bacterium]